MGMNTTTGTEIRDFERYIIAVKFPSKDQVCGILLSKERNILTMTDMGSVLSYLDNTLDLTEGDSQLYNAIVLCVVPMVDGYLHPEVSRLIIRSQDNAQSHYISKTTVNSGQTLEFVQVLTKLIDYFST